MNLSLTGGIGSGKSYVCRLLQLRGIEVFNCDIIAKTIIATHREVRDELCALVGVEELTKQALGDYIRRGPDCAARVNAIVHPRVAEAFERYCQQPATAPTASAEAPAATHHWMECAILFESGFDRLVDRVVVVTCPEEERIRRIIERDHCDAATARRWLALQMSDEERLQRAAAHNTATATTPSASAEVPAVFHIVNDGTTPLEPQLDALLQSL